jgi:D-apiose dehydrogenase
MIPRVAIVGSGYFAQFHLEAWQRLAAEGMCTIASVCDVDSQKSSTTAHKLAVAGYTDVHTMLSVETLDLIDIATPPVTHQALIEQSLQKGLAVVCQKPVAPTYDEALSIAAFTAQFKQPVWVHENFRWMPWFREMKAAIVNRKLGVLHDIAFRLRPGDGQGTNAYLLRQPYFQKMERFLVHETLIHLIDTYRFLMGEIVAVTAQLRRINPAIAGEDAGYVLFKFASGATGLIDANRLNDHNAHNTRLTMGEAWLEGALGVLSLNGNGDINWKPHLADEQPHPYAWSNIGFGGDCVYHQQRHVLNALAGNEKPVNLIEDYLINLKVEEAVYASNAQRREVTL